MTEYCFAVDDAGETPRPQTPGARRPQGRAVLQASATQQRGGQAVEDGAARTSGRASAANCLHGARERGAVLPGADPPHGVRRPSTPREATGVLGRQGGRECVITLSTERDTWRALCN